MHILNCAGHCLLLSCLLSGLDFHICIVELLHFNLHVSNLTVVHRNKAVCILQTTMSHPDNSKNTHHNTVYSPRLWSSVLWIRIHWIWIRIQIRVQHFKRIRIRIFFIPYKFAKYVPGPLKMTSKLQEKPSAHKREHPALQKMKFINFFPFCRSFLPSWIRFRIQGPHWIRIQSGYDPDPQHWFELAYFTYTKVGQR